MLLMQERQQIIHYCQLLITRGLTKGTGGNISIYNTEEHLVAISPSGIDYFEMRPEDVVIITPEMNVIDGNRSPSSEIHMHTIFYRERDDITAIVHAHSPYACVLSCLRQALPALHYLVALAGGTNVPCAKYATFGTPELARNVLEAMRQRRACLLANHGILTGGTDIAGAFNIMEEIEFMCELYIKTKAIGEPVILDDLEMQHMVEKFTTYNQKY